MGTTPGMRFVVAAFELAFASTFAFAASLAFAAPPARAGDDVAPRPPCKYEENCHCAAPGITLRWKAAYCMALAQTDDLENGGVQACLARPDPPAVRKRTACGQNAHWKARICRSLSEKADAEKCLRDKTFVPRFVEWGPGS